MDSTRNYRNYTGRLHLLPSSPCLQVHAFPSSSILIHIYCHIHMSALCSVLYLQPSFCFLFFFFYKFSRHLCHGAYWCTHNPAHMPRLLPICIFLSLIPAYVNLSMYTHNPAHRSIFLHYYTYTHRDLLPPHVHLCLPPNIHTYVNTCFCPFYRNLFFPYVFSYVYVYVCTCARMYVHVYLWIPCILFVFVSYVYSFFPTGLYTCAWCTVSCVFYSIFIITCFLQNRIKQK